MEHKTLVKVWICCWIGAIFMVAMVGNAAADDGGNSALGLIGDTQLLYAILAICVFLIIVGVPYAIFRTAVKPQD